MKLSTLTAAALLTAAVAALTSCDTDLTFERVPYARVYVAFTTEGDWHIYGATAPMESRRFIRSERVPADYPYTEMTFTGYGGVLLTQDPYGNCHAFDLSCPVERQPQVRIVVDREESLARCPKCGSTYDVFNITGSGGGTPLGGMAAKEHYGLRIYNVAWGADSRYVLLTN